MARIVSFEKAMQSIRGVRHRHLLLGNGFSIALKPDIFTYGSLYENADFSKAPHVTKLDASINAARKPIELSVSPFDPL